MGQRNGTCFYYCRKASIKGGGGGDEGARDGGNELKSKPGLAFFRPWHFLVGHKIMITLVKRKQEVGSR